LPAEWIYRQQKRSITAGSDLPLAEVIHCRKERSIAGWSNLSPASGIASTASGSDLLPAVETYCIPALPAE